MNGSVTIGCSVRLYPLNYKGKQKALEEQIPLGKFPTCGWSADSYTNWLTKNAIDITTNIINKGATATSLAVMSGGATVPLNIATSVLGLIGNFRHAELLPNIESGQNNGDVNFGSWNNNFVVERKRVKLEHLKIIDEYFTKYGYKINRVKLPNIASRTYFNYLKIASGEKLATGNVPLLALNEINQIAQNGVTIWHNVANIGNYSLNNTIIGG